MKSFLVALSFLTSLAPVAYGQVSTPTVGFVRYGSAPVQGINGIAGNFIAAPSIWGPAKAIAFGKSGGLIAAGGHVQLVSRNGSVLASFLSAESHPILSVGDSLASATAWLPARQTLLWVEEGTGAPSSLRFQAIQLRESALNTGVTSVSHAGQQSARFLESQSDGTVMSIIVALPSGQIRSEEVIPGLHAPAYEFNQRLIWADDHGLQIGTSDGILETLQPPVAGPFEAEGMSSGWIHLHFAADTAADWALNLNESHPSLFRLPTPSKGENR